MPIGRKHLHNYTNFASPSVKLTLIGARVGGVVGKAIASAVVEGKLSPEILGDALLSSSSLRAHVQAEALRIIAVRVSCSVPGRLSWLVKLVVDYLATQSCGGDALRTLGKRTLLYHITGFGLRGTIASALAAAAVQMSINTCWLVTSQFGVWRHVNASSAMSKAQYKYETITTAYTLIGTLAGGGVGAALGSLVLPGFGTALGSIVCSTCAGYLPAYWRSKKGPDDESRRQVEQLKSYHLLMASELAHGYVVMSKEDALWCVSAKEQQQQQEQEQQQQENLRNCKNKDEDKNVKNDTITSEFNDTQIGNECKCVCNFNTKERKRSSPSSLLSSNAYEEDSFVVFETARNSSSRQRSVGSSSTYSASASTTSTSSSSSSSSFSSLPISYVINNNSKVQESYTESEISVKERNAVDCNTKIPVDLVQSRICFQENLEDLHESEESECDNNDNNITCNAEICNHSSISCSSNIENANDVNGVDMFNLHQVTSFDDVDEMQTSQLDNNKYKKSFSSINEKLSKANVKRHNDALMRRIMGSKIEYIEGHSWSEIDTMVEGYSEDEVVFVFAVDNDDDDDDNDKSKAYNNSNNDNHNNRKESTPHDEYQRV